MNPNGNALLDTNAVILLLNNDPSLIEMLADRDNLLVSVITLGELYFGANKSQRRKSNLAKVDGFIKGSTVLGCDRDTARQYGDVKVLLKRKGKPIPENDLWIAATAIQHDLTLVTRDAHFRNVDGLRTESW